MTLNDSQLTMLNILYRMTYESFKAEHEEHDLINVKFTSISEQCCLTAKIPEYDIALIKSLAENKFIEETHQQINSPCKLTLKYRIINYFKTILYF